MPPQGLLVIAHPFRRKWDVRFVDENMRPLTDDDYRWGGCRVRQWDACPERERIREVAARAHEFYKIAVLGGPSVSACAEWYPEYDIVHVGELGDATEIHSGV
jgi:hypothetical protein